MTECNIIERFKNIRFNIIKRTEAWLRTRGFTARYKLVSNQNIGFIGIDFGMFKHNPDSSCIVGNFSRFFGIYLTHKWRTDKRQRENINLFSVTFNSIFSCNTFKHTIGKNSVEFNQLVEITDSFGRIVITADYKGFQPCFAVKHCNFSHKAVEQFDRLGRRQRLVINISCNQQSVGIFFFDNLNNPLKHIALIIKHSVAVHIFSNMQIRNMQKLHFKNPFS